MWSILLILSFLGQSVVRPDHALYIGVVKINCQKDSSEVMVQVFTDDLQDAIRQFAPGFQRAEEELFCIQNKGAISQYFNQYLQCRFDQQFISLKWQSATLVNESYQIRFRIRPPDSWQQLSVDAPFLMELFPTQSNVIQIERGSEKRYGRTTNQQPTFDSQF